MLEAQILHDRYKIIRKIGGGGMANVYLANDIILDREVAIKILRLEFADDDEFIERFDREAKAATSLSHPNIVNIFDVGEEENILFMAMEYVDGLTLQDYIRENGPLDVEESLKIMRQLSDAIAHAHVNGLIHRDIKPQNILMDRYGNVKVTDFGIALALSATSLTQTNSVLGSVHYLSPEQARGGIATKKSDIYALGLVMYELLTGELAFSGESAVSVALKHLQEDIPSVRAKNPNIPQSVENIILKATAKDAFHRYSTVYEMEEALNTALDANKSDEAKFTPPDEDGEMTKAIPVITDNQFQETKTFEQADPVVEEKPIKNKAKQKKPKKKFYKRKSFIIVLVLLVLSAIALTVYFMMKPKEVEIPDLVDYEYEEAVEALEELKLKTKKELIFSEEIEEGHIVKTDPKAGRKRKEKSVVTLFVSDGLEKVVFEDYVGKDFEQVKRLLLDLGYDEEEIIAYQRVSEQPVGEIIAQVQPLPDKEVVPSETTVIFEISNGPEKIKLSSLRGSTLDEAKDYAEENDLKLDVSEEESDSVDKGKIIGQDPDPNTEMSPGDTVKVVVSTGKKELPPRTHSENFTVTYVPTETPDAGDGEEGEEVDKEPELVPQKIRVYVGDANNDFSTVYHEDSITEDKEFNLTLVINPDSTAEFKVMRDEEVIIEKSIPFKDGD